MESSKRFGVLEEVRGILGHVDVEKLELGGIMST